MRKLDLFFIVVFLVSYIAVIVVALYRNCDNTGIALWQKLRKSVGEVYEKS